jgi:hypothetical protein
MLRVDGDRGFAEVGVQDGIIVGIEPWSKQDCLRVTCCRLLLCWHRRRVRWYKVNQDESAK